MARFQGTVQRSDLEGGVVQLATDDGDVYELEGAIDDGLIGKQVVVEGTVDKEAMSFTMTGPRLVVSKITAA